MNLDLFKDNKTNREVTRSNAASINGLKIYYDFISQAEEVQLLQYIDSSEWLIDLKRRVQHYGYKYNYRARKIEDSAYVGSLPDWLSFLINRLISNSFINFKPDQAIINEYIENQGIAAHIDCEPCFGDTILSLSLSGPCVMNFERYPNSKEKISLLLEPRTLVLMTGESRYNWYHSIPNCRSDYFNGNKVKRNRRVSITFRKAIIIT